MMLSYCGLDCEKCDALIATRTNDDALRAKVAREWAAAYRIEVAPADINCSGCLTAGVHVSYCEHLCEVRKCAKEKKVAHCAECPEYACSRLNDIFKLAPDAKGRLDALKKK